MRLREAQQGLRYLLENEEVIWNLCRRLKSPDPQKAPIRQLHRWDTLEGLYPREILHRTVC